MKTDDFSTSPSSTEERIPVAGDVSNPERKREEADEAPRLNGAEDLCVSPRKPPPSKSSQSLQLVRTFVPDEEKQLKALLLLSDAPVAENQND